MIPYLHADPLICVGCRICEIHCSFIKTGVFNPKNSRVRLVHIEPLTDFIVACRHCAVPKCAEVCPVKAITRQDDLVSVNDEKCIGCSACQEACPFGAMFTNNETNKAINCDRCGECVPRCPVNTLEISPADTIASKRRVLSAKQSSVQDE